MTLNIHPVTAGLWPSLETLFGPQGACYGCWCSYFRLAPKQREVLSRDDRKQLLKDATGKPLPPGLVALDDGVSGRVGAGNATIPCAALEHSPHGVTAA